MKAACAAIRTDQDVFEILLRDAGIKSKNALKNSCETNFHKLQDILEQMRIRLDRRCIENDNAPCVFDDAQLASLDSALKLSLIHI